MIEVNVLSTKSLNQNDKQRVGVNPCFSLNLKTHYFKQIFTLGFFNRRLWLNYLFISYQWCAITGLLFGSEIIKFSPRQIIDELKYFSNASSVKLIRGRFKMTQNCFGVAMPILSPMPAAGSTTHTWCSLIVTVDWMQYSYSTLNTWPETQKGN